MTIQYQNNWRSCILHITYMNNVHNWKCSNMQMANITHMHNIRYTLYVVWMFGPSKIIYSISRSLNAFMRNGMYFHTSPSNTKTLTFDDCTQSPNIIIIFYVDHSHLCSKRIEFNNVCKCCNFLSKSDFLLIRMAGLRSKKIESKADLISFW